MHRGGFPPGPPGALGAPFREEMMLSSNLRPDAEFLAHNVDPSDPKRQRALRSVFIANISFDTSEEQLTAILSEIGPVTSVKIVYDPVTGRPRGFGFGEYEDSETAMSAVRNLQGRVLNGRTLKFDSAINSPDEKFRPRPPVGPPLPNPEPSPYGERVAPQTAPEAITKAVASLPPEQMFELMRQMKHSVKTNPNESRQLLLHNPQLAYAILQALVIMRVVDPEAALKILHQGPRGPPLPTAPLQEPPAPLRVSTKDLQRGPAQELREPPHDPNRGSPSELHKGDPSEKQRGPPPEMQRGLPELHRGPHQEPPHRGLPQELHRGNPMEPRRGSPLEPPHRGHPQELHRGFPQDSHRGHPQEPHRGPISEMRRGHPQEPPRGPFQDPHMRGPPQDTHPPMRGPPFSGPPHHDIHRGPPPFSRDEPPHGRGSHDPRDGPPGRGDHFPPPRRDMPPSHGPPNQNRGGPPSSHFSEPPPRHGPGNRDHPFNPPMPGGPRGPRNMSGGGGPPMSSAGSSSAGQAPPPHSSGAQPAQRNMPPGGHTSTTPSSSGEGSGGAKITPKDQEKAALIMQVLGLTDEQISMLPSEQKQSILQLKEQITRGATPK